MPFGFKKSERPYRDLNPGHNLRKVASYPLDYRGMLKDNPYRFISYLYHPLMINIERFITDEIVPFSLWQAIYRTWKKGLGTYMQKD